MADTLKYAVLLGDGMADRPIRELAGKTPLMAARTPNMDSVARNGTVGTVRTIPEGMPAGSDVANLSVMGYDPAKIYTGRSPIEAAGMGLELGPDDVAFRCNLVTLGKKTGDGVKTDLSGTLSRDLVMLDFAGGHPSEEEAGSILKTLSSRLGVGSVAFHKGVSYRHLMVWEKGDAGLEAAPPHDMTGREIGEGWPEGGAAPRILELEAESIRLLADHPVNRRRAETGKEPVNAIWLWGQGKKPAMESFRDRFGLSGAMITAVDLMKGLGVSVGFEIVNVPGATGYLDTDYEGKARGALDALERVDLVYLHVEAPDEASHGGSVQNKIMALEDFDSRIVGPVLDGMGKFGSFQVLLLPDHATPLELKTHSRDPVPFAVFRSPGERGSGAFFNEEDAAAGMRIERGHELMGMFVRGEIG